MIEKFDQIRCLASLALFRELYDQKKDIYSVLATFTENTIKIKGIYDFDLIKITNLINETYDFSIPSAVVKTALKRLNHFVIKKEGHYYADKRKIAPSDFSEKYSDINYCYSTIINDLFTYIEEKIAKKLSDSEKDKAANSFCTFILDQSGPSEYAQLISAYIIFNNNNLEFIRRLNTIKEGVILETAIKYSSNLSETGSWSTDLTLYLDTEILFSLAGYNGELYESMFNEFYQLIEEINTKSLRKNKKKRIELKYFSLVEEEVINFFKRAESIVEKKATLDPSKTAMRSILNGCTTPSQVAEKRGKFFYQLKILGVNKDDYMGYYKKENHIFNIEDPELVRYFNEKLSEDVKSNIRLLNLVNILRKGNNNGRFDEAEYFLLTGNYTTIQIANNQKVKQNGQIPLATTLNFLIDRFWFTLNKGFGQSSRLKSFDVTTKAQIVLASIINKSVTKAFDALKVELSSGRLTKEQSEYILADLRQRSKKPEDIIPDDLNELLDSLDNASIEIALQEKEIIRNKAKKNEAENIFLKDEYKKKDEQLRALNIELQRYKEEEKQKNYKSLKRKILFRKCLFIFLLILFIGIAICLCVYVFTNTERLNKLGSAIGIFAALITVVGFLYYTICQIYKLFKKVNP